MLAVLLCSKQSFGQSLGDPIVDITFGSGTATRSGALSADSGATSYIYSNTGFPSDNYYTIANTTSGMFTGWWTTTDHTGNTGGYMMIVNGSYTPGIFYTRTVTGLCGATTYQFAAWIKNLLNYNGILPNVTFSIETAGGTVLGSGNTGNIATGNTWIQYPFTFTTPAGTDVVVIKMTNNAAGGIGNDIAIDDITFRPYGSTVAAVFNQSTATAQSTCAGSAQTYTVNTTSALAAGYVQKLQMYVSGAWQDLGTASTATSFTVSSPTIAGTYQYRLVSSLADNISSSNCVVSSNTLTITVNAAPTALFTAADTTCLGNPLIFTDKSTSTSGTISAWLWDFGDGTTAATQSPSHTYTTAGPYTVKLTVTNSNGCASSFSKTVNISAVAVAAFGYSTPDCVSSAVTITDQSTIANGTLVSWLWDYGDGSTETKTSNQAFQHTYTSAGTYVIKLTVTGNLGCSATVSRSILVSPLPVVNFGTPDVCLADASALFTDSTTIADNSKLTYLWNFGDANASAANPNTSTLQNPSHKYTKAAIYQVSLTVTSANGCSFNKTRSFTVNGSVPVAAFTVLNPTELCSDREVFITNQSTVDFGSITKIEMIYDYVNQPAVIETDDAPYYNKLYRYTYTAFHSGTKSYQVRMLAFSGGTCVAIADKTITLLAVPTLSFPAISGICLNAGKVQLAASETSGIAGSGVYAGTAVSTSGLFDPATAGVGTYLIKYIFTAGNACADTISQVVTVNTIPTAYAGPDITVLEGGTGILEAKATGDSLTYSWSPATNLSSSTILNPVVTPGEVDITYTLTVTNGKGCSASGSATVSVLKSPVIPNTFTPNGDGVNDTWNIKYLETYTGCTVEIFNRNGQRVFNSIGYPVPWDGRYNNIDVPAGVYYYVINPKHGRKVFSGWVSVIR